MRYASLLLPLALLAVGCVQTDSVLLQQGDQYSPSGGVELLLSEGDARPELEPIAIIEANGGAYANAGRTDLIRALREEAQELGAHAIYVISSEEQYVPPTYTENVDGSLLTIPGGYESSMLGIALRDPNRDEAQSEVTPQQFGSTRTVRGGVNVNVVPLALGGYGMAGWLGVNSFRANVEYFTLNTPESLVRDEFTDGQVDNSFRIDGDYFVNGNLRGFFLGAGFTWGEFSSSRENFSGRESYDSSGFSFSIGYNGYVANYINISTRAALDFRPYQDDEVSIGGRTLEPDTVTPFLSVGIGFSF